MSLIFTGKINIQTLNLCDERVIEKSFVERDLGLMIYSDLKRVTQVEKATKAAKAIIDQINNSFRYFDAEQVRLLYVSLVRPH